MRAWICGASSEPTAPDAGRPRAVIGRVMSPTWVRRIRLALIGASAIPLLRIVLWPVLDRAGANPVEFVTRSSGTWTLVFLLLALAVSPLQRLSGAGWLMRLRRPLGLACFGYALVHLSTWIWLEHWFELAAMLRDVLRRPFITVGVIAFAMLLPLALTSTDAMMRRLGRRWSVLHRLVYPAAVLAVLHYWWHKAGKADIGEPALYAAVLVLLLVLRPIARRRASAARQPGRQRSSA